MNHSNRGLAIFIAMSLVIQGGAPLSFSATGASDTSTGGGSDPKFDTPLKQGDYSTGASGQFTSQLNTIQAKLAACTSEYDSKAALIKAQEEALLIQAKEGGLLDASSGKKKSKSVTEIVVEGAKAVALGGAGVDVTKLCQDTGDDAKSLTCEQFSSDKGFSTKEIKQREAALGVRIQACQIKNSKLDLLGTKVKCFAANAGMISQTIGNESPLLLQAYQAAQGEIMEVKNAISDREGQLTAINDKLTGNGDPNSPFGGAAARGEKGLLALKDEMEAYEASLPRVIASVKSGHEEVAFEKKRIENLVTTRKSSLMAECFSGNSYATYRCKNGDKPVSARDYLACRYEQTLQLGANGALERNSKKKTQASAGKAAVESLMDAILADIASGSSSSSQGKDGKTHSSFARGGAIKTPDDIEKKYGAQLASLSRSSDGAPMVNVRGFVLQAMKSCYTKAQSAVDEERQMPDSEIGAKQAEVRKLEVATATNTDTQVDEAAKKLSNMVEAMTGIPTPLNTERCKNVSPEGKVTCLQDLSKNITSMLKGTSASSLVQMAFAAKGDPTGGRNISMKCYGLQGCARMLKTASQNLNTVVGSLHQHEAKRVGEINQKLLAQINNYRTVAQTATGPLAAEITEMNVELASLGGSGSIKTSPVKCVELEPDSALDGLYKSPTDLVSMVGGCAKPPLPDIAADDFSSANEGIADAGEKIAETMAKLADFKAAFPGKVEECKNQAVKDAAKEIEDLVSELEKDTMNCGFAVNSSKKSLTEILAGDLEEILKDYEKGSTAYRKISSIKSKVGSIKTGVSPTSIMTPEELQRYKNTFEVIKRCRNRKADEGDTLYSNQASSEEKAEWVKDYCFDSSGNLLEKYITQAGFSAGIKVMPLDEFYDPFKSELELNGKKVDPANCKKIVSDIKEKSENLENPSGSSNSEKGS